MNAEALYQQKIDRIRKIDEGMLQVSCSTCGMLACTDQRAGGATKCRIIRPQERENIRDLRWFEAAQARAALSPFSQPSL